MKELGERLDQSTIDRLKIMHDKRDSLSPTARLLISQEIALQKIDDPEAARDFVKSQNTLLKGMSLLDQAHLESVRDALTLQGRLKGVK